MALRAPVVLLTCPCTCWLVASYKNIPRIQGTDNISETPYPASGCRKSQIIKKAPKREWELCPDRDNRRESKGSNGNSVPNWTKVMERKGYGVWAGSYFGIHLERCASSNREQHRLETLGSVGLAEGIRAGIRARFRSKHGSPVKDQRCEPTRAELWGISASLSSPSLSIHASWDICLAKASKDGDMKKTVGVISTGRQCKRFGVYITPVNTWVKVNVVDVLCSDRNWTSDFIVARLVSHCGTMALDIVQERNNSVTKCPHLNTLGNFNTDQSIVVTRRSRGVN
ncbi:hypothetical protein B0H13DRAFT_1870369 [Mycena leptocephala]|nr:hypothetical protein B0H13DRAFT_1870369 [Mycena leptocephala]